MIELYTQIEKERMMARIARDVIKSNLLTTLKSDIDMRAKNEVREVTLEDVLSALKKFKNSTEETIALVLPGTSVLLKLNKELEIINSFLPAQVSGVELEQTIDIILMAFEKPTMKNMGSIMGELKRQLNGNYDAKVAGEILKRKLGQ